MATNVDAKAKSALSRFFSSHRAAESPEVRVDACLADVAEPGFRSLHEASQRHKPSVPILLEGVSLEDRAETLVWIVKAFEVMRFGDSLLYESQTLLDRYYASAPREEVRGSAQCKLLASVCITLKAGSPVDMQRMTFRDMIHRMGRGTVAFQDVVCAELAILKKLGFRVGTPTARDFLEALGSRLRGMERMSRACWNLAEYLLQLTLVDPRLHYRFPHCVLAASAFTLAMYTLRAPASAFAALADDVALCDADAALMPDTGVVPCCAALHRLWLSNCNAHNQTQYGRALVAKFPEVAAVPPPERPPQMMPTVSTACVATPVLTGATQPPAAAPAPLVANIVVQDANAAKLRRHSLPGGQQDSDSLKKPSRNSSGGGGQCHEVVVQDEAAAAACADARVTHAASRYTAASLKSLNAWANTAGQPENGELAKKLSANLGHQAPPADSLEDAISMVMQSLASSCENQENRPTRCQRCRRAPAAGAAAVGVSSNLQRGGYPAASAATCPECGVNGADTREWLPVLEGRLRIPAERDARVRGVLAKLQYGADGRFRLAPDRQHLLQELKRASARDPIKAIGGPLLQPACSRSSSSSTSSTGTGSFVSNASCSSGSSTSSACNGASSRAEQQRHRRAMSWCGQRGIGGSTLPARANGVGSGQCGGGSGGSGSSSRPGGRSSSCSRSSRSPP
eukprot:TRINITY_DN4781_c0_g2_i1.p1 TRINITY_DN4781_c0_g2~~TRINITY_DN4781_c0_g2_i1.p1  ORF type:complete len:686 (+),score=144.81 TRINITY_DN4781_c0_g2_i1:151-2208(+)